MKLEKIVKINKLEVNDSIFKENSYTEITLENVLSFEETKKIMDNFINKKAKLTLEVEEPILDDAERKYLSSVIRPFRDRIEFIRKREMDIGDGAQYINIVYSSEYDDDDNFCLPYFKKDTMYKNMKLNKEYTLEELGL